MNKNILNAYFYAMKERILTIALIGITLNQCNLRGDSGD